MSSSVVNTPTFSRTNMPGWYTRLIYSFNNGNDTAIDCTGDFFSEVDSDFVRGSVEFQRGYWDKSEGRILRMKGCFLYSGDGTQLNMQPRLYSNSGNVSATSNKDTYHTFANGSDRIDCPVFFEIELLCKKSNQFSWSGFYQYEWDGFNGGDPTNVQIAYVPIYNEDTLENVVTTTNDSYLKLEIGPNDIKPIFLTIEEIG
jgi:hypothetical protein